MNHDSYPDTYIRSVLGSVKSIAMVGATANPSRPAYLVMKYLIGKGYRMIPVNPGHAGGTILGQPVYASLSDIPFPVDMVDIFRRADAVGPIVDEALSLPTKPRVIWMQLTIRNDEAAAKAEAAGVSVVMDRCPKIEYGRLCGENTWAGINTGRLSSKKPEVMSGFQHLKLPSAD